MNGRVYDPLIGRFLSPDIYIQAPFNTQSFNRYSYVLNNPLSLVDPSGYCGESTGQSSGNGEVTFFYNPCNGGNDRGMTFTGMNAQYFMQSMMFFSNSGYSGMNGMGYNTNNNYENPVYDPVDNSNFDQARDIDRIHDIWEQNAPEGFEIPEIGGFEDLGPDQGGKYSVLDRLLGKGITLNEKFDKKHLSISEVPGAYSAIGHESFHHNQNIIVHALQALGNAIGITHDSVDQAVFDMTNKNEGLSNGLGQMMREVGNR